MRDLIVLTLKANRFIALSFGAALPILGWLTKVTGSLSVKLVRMVVFSIKCCHWVPLRRPS